MTTLMRSDRDRRLGKPVKGHAILERMLLVGTRSADHIRASGHSGCIATGQASTRKTGRIHGCTRTLRRPTRLAAIALANKIAKMAWAMMAKGERYKEPAALAA